MGLKVISLLTATMLAAGSAFAAQEQTQNFTYKGTLTAPDGVTPIATSVNFKLQIYNGNTTGIPANDCLLYEEAQNNVDLTATLGQFALTVGSATASPKRTANDAGLSMAQVFSNTGTVTVASPLCAAGTYTPIVGAVRRLRVTLSVPSYGFTETLTPDMPMGAVPQATVAETLQGFLPTDFLKKDGTVPLTGPLAFATWTTGTRPGAPATGATGFNTSTGYLESWTGATWVDYSAGAGGGSVSVSPPLQSTGGATPTLSIPVATGAANGYLASADWTNFNNKVNGKANLNTVNAIPRVSAAGTLTEATGLNYTTAGNINTLSLQAGTTQGTSPLQNWFASDGTTVLYGLNGAGNPTAATDLVTKSYVSTAISSAVTTNNASYLPLSGGTMTGAIAMGAHVISGVTNPTNPQDAATKAYVDSSVTTSGGLFVKVDGSVPLTGPWAAGQSITAPNFTSSAQSGLALGTYGVAAGNTGEARFYELTANGTTYTGFKSPDLLSSSLIYVLPGTAPLANQVLTVAAPAGGVSSLSWSTPSGGGITSLNGSSVASQTFANGTAGTAPAFSTVVGTGVHTLNIPLASTATVTGGVIANSDYTTFNAKVDGKANLTTAGSILRTASAGTAQEAAGLSVGTTANISQFIIKAGSAQAATHLEDWQNNAGTVLSYVDSAGFFFQPGAPTAATLMAATTAYVDAAVTASGGSYVKKDGTVALTGAWNAGQNITATSFSSTAQPGLVLSPYNTGAGQTGEQRYLELAANGTTYTGFKAPDLLSSSLIYTLPGTAPLANQVLTAAAPAGGVSSLSWTTPSGGGITSLNGSSVASQTFANGTAGTAPAFSTVVGTGVHTLNIPLASTATVTGGVIANSDYTTFNAKVDGKANLTTAGSILRTASAGTAQEAAGLSVGTTANISQFIIKAGSAQAATHLEDWQNNAGTVLSYVDSAGFFFQPGAPTAATLMAATTAYVDAAVTASGGSYVKKDGTVALTAAWNAGNAINNISTLSVGTATAPTGGVATFNGSVGIGTTAPAFPLHVSVSDNTGSKQVKIENTNNGTAAFAQLNMVGDTANMDIGQAGSGVAVTGSEKDGLFSYMTASGASSGLNLASTNAAGMIKFYTGGSAAANQRMKIDASGNVGIGPGTPGQPLDVTGNARVSANIMMAGANEQFLNLNANMIAIQPIPTNTDALFGIEPSGTNLNSEFDLGGNNGLAGLSTYGFIKQTGLNTTVGNHATTGNLYLAANNAVAMTILPAGNVGIGVTSPKLPLHVMTGSTTGYPTYLAGTDSAVFEGTTNSMVHALGAAAGQTGFEMDTPTIRAISAVYYDGATNLAHFTNSSNGISLNSAGKVAVGNFNPTATLDVAGQIHAQVYSNGASTAIDWNNGNVQTTSAACSGTGTQFSFTNMLEGGSYTLIVTGTATGSCNFSNAGSTSVSPAGVTGWAFVPTNATAGAGTAVYTMLRAGNVVYVSWISGFPAPN